MAIWAKTSEEVCINPHSIISNGSVLRESYLSNSKSKMVYQEMSEGMLSGIGVDIISITRIKNAVENSGKVFLDEVYTEWEQERAKSHSDPIAYFAMTFAAKEAIFKCFSIGWETGVKFTEIEITDGKSGEPFPVLKGRFAELASERGVTRILLSLSYDTEYAVGTANLIGSKE